MPDPVDPVAAADPWSRSATYLTMSYGNEPIAVGSGIIAQHPNGQRYLITALHNLTGREPVTGEVKSNTGAIPNKVRVEAFYTDFEMNLYQGENDPNSDQARFRTHKLGTQVDLTVLPVTAGVDACAQVDPSFLTEQKNSRLMIHVAQECYIVGFPEGLVSRPQNHVVFPVWKTGHIASEPHIDFYPSLPVLLVDATTRRGMSGAPVIVRSQNGTRLVGIYSGRFKQPLGTGATAAEADLQFTAELGWVFKWRAIDELIRQPA